MTETTTITRTVRAPEPAPDRPPIPVCCGNHANIHILWFLIVIAVAFVSLQVGSLFSDHRVEYGRYSWAGAREVLRSVDPEPAPAVGPQSDIITPLNVRDPSHLVMAPAVGASEGVPAIPDMSPQNPPQIKSTYWDPTELKK